MISACAPAQPAPHSKVTLPAACSIAASRSTSRTGGATVGGSSGIAVPDAAGASARNTSPGMTTTETPRRITASRMAMSRVRPTWEVVATGLT